MGVAVVEDANGVRSVLVSTSESRGYLRPGVSLQEGEKVVTKKGSDLFFPFFLLCYAESVHGSTLSGKRGQIYFSIFSSLLR